MILTQKDAQLLKRSNTIDLKYMNAKDYVDQIEGNTQLMKNLKKILVYVGIVGYLASCFYAWGIIYPETANANNTGEHTAFLHRFPEKSTVISCYNTKTLEIRQEKKCTRPGDQNIILPARDQISIWLKYYTEEQIINRLSLVNFESSFNENAGNPYAKGYVQTLRTYNISPDIDSQLSWMKNHKEGYTRPICSKYWTQYNSYDSQDPGEYAVLSCIYRMHYHAYKGVSYARKGIYVTKYYKWYMFGIGGIEFNEKY